jgi:hypothetical protein
MQLLAARISHPELARGQALTGKTTARSQRCPDKIKDILQTTTQLVVQTTTTRAIFSFLPLFSFLNFLRLTLMRSIQLTLTTEHRVVQVVWKRVTLVHRKKACAIRNS